MDRAFDIYTEKQVGEHPWILRRAALEIQKHSPETVLNPLVPRGVLSYFINYALYRDVPGIRIGHFTHLEEKGPYRRTFLETISKCDWYTVTCAKTKAILIENGASEDRIRLIRYGSDARLFRPLRFGVVGRTYRKSGRKGEHLVAAMVEAGFDFVSWGRGWPCPEMFDGSPWDSLPDFYQAIDCLVVTSLNEGGPVPVIDAMAAGVPVIAPDVGWCWEFPVIRYQRGSMRSLLSTLYQLTNPPTWEKWAACHLELFEEAAA